MQTLSEKEILLHIRQQEPFAAVIDTGAFSIKVDRYIPAVHTAIHAGHTLHKQFEDKLLLDQRKRQHKEDPYTGVMLASFPIVLQGLDSRYLYDLNRPPEEATDKNIQEEQIWSRPSPPENEKKTLLDIQAITEYCMPCSQFLKINFPTVSFMICTPIITSALQRTHRCLMSAPITLIKRHISPS